MDQDSYADVLPDMASGYMVFPKAWWCMDEVCGCMAFFVFFSSVGFWYDTVVTFLPCLTWVSQYHRFTTSVGLSV